jgi:hypothetical protein
MVEENLLPRRVEAHMAHPPPLQPPAIIAPDEKPLGLRRIRHRLLPSAGEDRIAPHQSAKARHAVARDGGRIFERNAVFECLDEQALGAPADPSSMFLPTHA